MAAAVKDHPPIRLTLPRADHTRVRVAAARQGLSMAEFARRAVLAAAGKNGSSEK